MNVNVAGVPITSRNKLVYTDPSGRYMGTIEFDAADLDSLVTMATLFQEACARQAGRIQPVGAAALNGLKQ